MKAIEIQNQFGIIFLTFNGKWDLFYFTDEETIQEAIEQMKAMGGTGNVAQFLAENHSQFGDSEEMEVADPFQHIKQYNLPFMRKAVDAGKTDFLTVEIAADLKGKKIRTIYYGYDHQDGVDEFVVGDVVPFGKKLALFTADGRNTYIFAHPENHGAFTCSDSDRFVKYMVVSHEG